eukprot:523156-Rhodomonas_salina.2
MRLNARQRIPPAFRIAHRSPYSLPAVRPFHIESAVALVRLRVAPEHGGPCRGDFHRVLRGCKRIALQLRADLGHVAGRVALVGAFNVTLLPLVVAVDAISLLAFHLDLLPVIHAVGVGEHWAEALDKRWRLRVVERRALAFHAPRHIHEVPQAVRAVDNKRLHARWEHRGAWPDTEPVVACDVDPELVLAWRSCDAHRAACRDGRVRKQGLVQRRTGLGPAAGAFRRFQMLQLDVPVQADAMKLLRALEQQRRAALVPWVARIRQIVALANLEGPVAVIQHVPGQGHACIADLKVGTANRFAPDGASERAVDIADWVVGSRVGRRREVVVARAETMAAFDSHRATEGRCRRRRNAVRVLRGVPGALDGTALVLLVEGAPAAADSEGARVGASERRHVVHGARAIPLVALDRKARRMLQDADVADDGAVAPCHVCCASLLSAHLARRRAALDWNARRGFVHVEVHSVGAVHGNAVDALGPDGRVARPRQRRRRQVALVAGVARVPQHLPLGQRSRHGHVRVA